MPVSLSGPAWACRPRPSSKSRSTSADQRVDGLRRRRRSARICSTVPLRRLGAITLTMLLASNQGPSAASATSTSAAKVLASLVNFTDGRACRPTSWVIRTVASAVADIIASSLIHAGDSSCAVATTSRATRRRTPRSRPSPRPRRSARCRSTILLRARLADHLDRHLAVGLGAAEIDEDRDARLRPGRVDRLHDRLDAGAEAAVADCRRTRRAAPRRRPSGAPCRRCPRRPAANARR